MNKEETKGSPLKERLLMITGQQQKQQQQQQQLHQPLDVTLREPAAPLSDFKGEEV